MEDSQILNLFFSRTEEAIQEYADSQGKKILRIMADIANREELGVAVADVLIKNQSDSEATILVSGQRAPNVTVTEAACRVIAGSMAP